jgi:hypothetical protein
VTTRTQMNDKRTHKQMQKPIDEDAIGLYEILELNVSEPILFQGDTKNQQQTYKTADSERNKQVILVVPKEIGTRRRLTN